MGKDYSVDEAIASLVSQGAQYKDEIVDQVQFHGRTKNIMQKTLICDMNTGKFGIKSRGKIQFLKSKGIKVEVIPTDESKINERF